MPTVYKPILDHRPLAVSSEADKIDADLDSNIEELAELAFPHVKKVSREQIANLRHELAFFLLAFISRCSATPLRSPNKLKATLRKIAREPKAFIENFERYDATVSDLVCYCYSSKSPKQKRAWLLFEAGQGTLVPSLVSAAAQDAMAKVENQKLQIKLLGGKRGQGRTGDELQKFFAIGLADILYHLGGKVIATERGPFWKFVEILREPLRPHAKLAGTSHT